MKRPFDRTAANGLITNGRFLRASRDRRRASALPRGVDAGRIPVESLHGGGGGLIAPVASRLLEGCELLLRIGQPTILELDGPADIVNAAQRGLDPGAVQGPHEFDEPIGRSLLDQEARQGDALGVVEAPILGLGVVHRHELVHIDDPAGFQGLPQFRRASLCSAFGSASTAIPSSAHRGICWIVNRSARTTWVTSCGKIAVNSWG